jgi:uncharacterized membrane protein
VKSVLVIAMVILVVIVTAAVGIGLARGNWGVLVVPLIFGAGLLHERRKARKKE